MKPSLTSTFWANDRLRLVVTASCNLDCFYCHNEGQPKADSFISDSLFDRITELIHLAPPQSVTFTGGEALLHPRIEYFVRAIKLQCPSVTLVTNGILLTEERLGKLVDAGIGKIRLGVDSFARNKSRPSRGMSPAFNPAQLIARIQDQAVELEINVVLTAFNITEIPAMFRFCAENKISAKIFEHVEVAQFGTSSSMAQMKRKPIVEFSQLEAALKQSGIPFDTKEAPEFAGANFILQGDGFSWRYCRYLCPFGLCYMTGTRIDSTGEAYACMEKRFVETLSLSGELAADRDKLARIRNLGCCR